MRQIARHWIELRTVGGSLRRATYQACSVPQTAGRAAEDSLGRPQRVSDTSIPFERLFMLLMRTRGSPAAQHAFSPLL